MGIHNISYYGWNSLDARLIDGLSNASASCLTIVEHEGTLLAGGYIKNQDTNTQYSWSKKSTDQGKNWADFYINSSSFASVDKLVSSSGNLYISTTTTYNSSTFFISSDAKNFQEITPNSASLVVDAISVDSSGNIFISAKKRMFSSSDQGLTWGSQNVAAFKSTYPSSIIASFDDKLYSGVTDEFSNSPNINYIIYLSTNSGSTWSSVYSNVEGALVNSSITSIKLSVDALNKVIYSVIGNTNGTLLSSSDNGSTWGEQTIGDTFLKTSRVGIDSNGNVILCGQNGYQAKYPIDLYTSGSTNLRLEGAFTSSFDNTLVTSLYVSPSDRIYITGRAGKNSFIRTGKLTSNSASFGSRLLATSFGYVQSETLTSSLSGTSTIENFNLNNISEFPHSSGLFQMPSMVLGTKSSGRAGKTDDSIVQKRFIGSFVRVMWPKQDDTDVKGYDIGRQPGKLSTDWQFGDITNIEGKNFDSLALNCTIAKQISGTSDSILVRIETRPINDIGFSINQTTSGSISGSYAEEIIYRDQLHRKDIDYGDLSVSEISWKIPIDLKNIKELRIAVKHKTGQSEEKNKNCLIVGRFVKNSKDTEET